MKSHTISVTVENASIHVQPDPLVMTTQDDVKWTSGNARRFSIEFEGSGPFASRSLAFSDATAKQRPRVQGRFKYTVISEENPSLQLDPQVIVDPPPTGQG